MDKAKLLEELQADEGCVLTEYKDHLGFSTIGVGRLIDKRRGGGITHDEAMYLLNNDVDKRLAALEKALPWFGTEPDEIQRALLNMSFQMGVDGLLGFKNTLNLIEQGKYAEAADNALKSLWARQTPERAKRVTDMIRNVK